MFWVAMKPGVTFTDQWLEDDDYYAGIMHSLSGGSFDKPAQEWKIYFWTLAFDGGLVERPMRIANLQKFDGEQKMVSMPLDLQNLKGNRVAEDLISHGKLYWSHLREKCRYYKGKTKTFPHNEVDGLVMVDMDVYFDFSGS
ncbi:hypothetical protein BU23DRAFT_652922 [Bimuria novae-zelandiae CBS 107.79]|uniref:Uncharacterized protein n=1 Tax=Bimuria novae-zelandiae CBS 107.79 TaxID=1447943 RepID=A0A6A5UWT1_9PLEO|nr:hypothetical protein BU23DRAFT_652922 [Bimuria novae-zelandiae CBS 107.79]